ncbi:IPT/TIG domain protein [Geobacter sp. OR-1]|uniref:IPT/TIG domain-containing protein n=1 Tax=Geobacter sp. OR-1 TaxID=1266765 RepID=UPI000543A3E6|nr:IPT/TIG domain-containing protein [Geobacter sp. OR-1]GAM11388.1 IPT/TIG domain protein [Geobacter sp. OR-1]
MPGFIVILLAVLLSLPAVAAEIAPKPAAKTPVKKTQSAQERITILSIIPAQGEPGMTVTLSGTGFSETSTAFLGSVEIPAKLLGPKQLSFEIPRIQPGLYALFVKNNDGATSKTYNFAIQPLKPVVQSLSPDTVPACTTSGSREVTITGKNFQEGAQVLFDGGGIRSRYSSPETIGFTVPAVRGGIHQVQVRNPEETTSSPLALLIDNRPEISAITPGTDYVNYYELSVEGRNFLQGSVLVVDGQRISGGTPMPGNRDRLIYMDCTQLIYQRYPADPTPRTLRVQVVNPGNEESPVITINAP